MTSPLTKDRLNIHQVTLNQCDFRQSVECFARHGVRKTAVWREKLDAAGLDDAVRILDDNGVETESLCPGGFLTEITDAPNDPMTENNRRWLDQAAALGARSMVTITGGFTGGSKDMDAARARAVAGLRRLVPIARAAGVKLALEPLHPMVCGNRSILSTVAEALEILDEVDAEDTVGLAVDSYAVWWEPGLRQSLERAGQRILNLHVSDWLPETRSVRFDRGMPGDGIIENAKIRHWAEQSGYAGAVEVEIFSSEDWWTREPDEVVTTILDRMEAHL